MNRVDPASPFGHKIRPRHRDRLAVVYIRQSTPQQVASNRESADLQYQLRQRAVTLGWADDRVLVIDDDQGISGTSVENRPGFQRLLAEVSLGHVGVVFGREMNRLARSCADWHRLLELCALFQVLLADADGVYDPADFNDRLLLGLKGTMSEAELHILRARLHQGKLNKARRGELFTCVPVGYVRVPDGGITQDPDEQVRSVVALVFTKFAELGSLTKTHAYLVANNIQFGLRVYKGPGKGRLVWQRPRRSSLYEMLHYPFYAGAYVFGRCPFDPTRRVPNKPKSGRRVVPPEEWVRLLKDKVPAYITWDQYEENQRRFAANDLGGGSKGVAGRAPTLLNGIVRCGRCGKPMGARNARADANPRYACDSEYQEYGGPRCQSVVAAYPDRLVESLVRKAMEPASLELSLRAAERDREQLHAHWKRLLERAGYEADRAKRQYDAVDPENRLVARALERQEKLRARMLELRGDGRTADAIAAALNREGYHVARGDAFSGARVHQLLAKFGQTGVPPGVRDASDLPGAGECWLPELAKRLGVKPIIVHRWRWSGWLHARQLRGENGRWVVWANAAEVTRLRGLRAFEIKYHGRRTPPAKLTTRAKRPGSARPTTRSQSGGG